MPFKILESKDPDSLNVNYKFDFSDYLATGETVASIVSVTSNDGALTVGSSAITDSGASVTVYLSGGTSGQYATVTVRFTASGSPTRTDERTFQIFIKEL